MGYRIPRGTPLMLIPYYMHVSSHNYLAPYKFWPQRWLPDASEGEAHGLQTTGGPAEPASMSSCTLWV